MTQSPILVQHSGMLIFHQLVFKLSLRWRGVCSNFSTIKFFGKTYEERVFIQMYLIVNVIVIMNMIYKLFHHLYILL